tara:strand:+ start:9355 stop:9954 length:600 start_codon:yes stop_codon:yes gene_type:complete
MVLTAFTNYFTNYFAMGVIAVIISMYYETNNNDLIYVESTSDNRKYLVRNLPDKNKSSNMMAKIRENLVTIRDYMSTNHSNDPRTTRLVKKFNPQNIMETEKGSKYTSYSINKGEKLVFCLRAKDGTDKLTDINTITFVALHELSHILTESIGHTPEFWENFKFILKMGVKLGIYKKVDYSINPKEYCGMNVTDSPLTN